MANESLESAYRRAIAPGPTKKKIDIGGLLEAIFSGAQPGLEAAAEGSPEFSALAGLGTGISGAARVRRERPQRELETLTRQLQTEQVDVPEEIQPLVGGRKTMSFLEFQARLPLIEATLKSESINVKRERAKQQKTLADERAARESKADPRVRIEANRAAAKRFSTEVPFAFSLSLEERKASFDALFLEELTKLETGKPLQKAPQKTVPINQPKTSGEFLENIKLK